MPAEGSQLSVPPPVCPEAPVPEAAAPKNARACFSPIEHYGVSFCYQLTASMVMHEPPETEVTAGLSNPNPNPQPPTRNHNPDPNPNPNLTPSLTPAPTPTPPPTPVHPHTRSRRVSPLRHSRRAAGASTTR